MKDTRCAQARRVWGRSEMRKQLVAIFLPLLILVLVAAAAETPITGSAASNLPRSNRSSAACNWSSLIAPRRFEYSRAAID